MVRSSVGSEPVLATMDSDYGHSTAARVAMAAQQSGVGSLVLTHFSPRYGISGGTLTMADVRAEAAAHFDGQLHLALDFDRIAIAYDGSGIEVNA